MNKKPSVFLDSAVEDILVIQGGNRGGDFSAVLESHWFCTTYMRPMRFLGCWSLQVGGVVALTWSILDLLQGDSEFISSLTHSSFRRTSFRNSSNAK